MLKQLGTICVLLIVGLALTAHSASQKNIKKNQLELAEEVTRYVEGDNHTPFLVEGALATGVARGAEHAAVLNFVEKYKKVYYLENAYTDLTLKKVQKDKLGMQHLRYQQHHKGLPVIGGDLVAHINEAGDLTVINGTMMPVLKVDTRPNVTADAAILTAEADLELFFGTGQTQTPELVVFPWEDKNYLAWRMFLMSDVPMGRWEYFIDAKTGEVIFKANRIMDAEEIGTGIGVMGNTYTHVDTWFDGSVYALSDHTRQLNNNIHGHNGEMADGAVIETFYATSWLPGTLATSPDNVWFGVNDESPAVDGHLYSALMYDWMLREFNRNSFNDAGATMRTTVNYSAEGDNNAYWNGAQIVVWSWSSTFRSLAGCPDVIAHEWGHAVTDYTSNLIYQKESGALNESFSDMIGAAFEFAHDTLDPGDWLMAENARLSGVPFRDMAFPNNRFDPDTYGPGSAYWIDVINCTPTNQNDWCGVHTNSGVGNKWFYLLSDGDTHNGVTVTGIGVEDAMQVAYRANAFYWTSNSTYSQAALGTILAARDLDPSGVFENSVMDAWNAVNVTLPDPLLAFTYPNGIPEILTEQTPTTFQVQVVGLYQGVPVAGSGQLHYTINAGPLQSVTMTDLGSDLYEATLPSLSCGERVDFYVSAEMEDTPSNQLFNDPDPSAANIAYPTNSTTIVFEDDFETNKGWTVSGDWLRGVPSGGGGAYGNPDPTAGSNGPNVLGYNLSGDYPNNLTERPVFSPPFDCTDMDRVQLNFKRWLGVESPEFDHAYIKVSSDGSVWYTVWENDVEYTDNSWNDMTVSLSPYADNQPVVYVQFVMGTTDGGWTYCGWNIDDLKIIGHQCVDPYVCGDYDDNGVVDISDLLKFVDFLFLNPPGPGPVVPEAADMDASSQIDISDLLYFVDYFFADPVGPAPICGTTIE